jgi:hypothetical protein
MFSLLLAQTNPDLTDLQQTLAFLAGPAGVVAWYIFVSDTLRNWTAAGKFDKFSPLGLSLLNIGISFGTPSIAFVLINVFSEAEIATVQPIYSFVATLLLSYLAQQGYFWVKGNLGSKAS